MATDSLETWGELERDEDGFVELEGDLTEDRGADAHENWLLSQFDHEEDEPVSLTERFSD